VCVVWYRNCDIAGGLELTCFDECLIVEEIAYGCCGIANAVGASSLGVSVIIVFSIQEQLF
jgi:acyl-CoA dehydrogenase